MIFYFRIGFDEEEYVEFSKVIQDRVIGTKGEVATVRNILQFINFPYWF